MTGEASARRLRGMKRSVRREKVQPRKAPAGAAKRREMKTGSNSCIKPFPDLMAGKKLLYVHGFGSSGRSGTVARLREVFPEATVVAPDLPVEPGEAMALLRETCRKERPHLIVGTSMGGMFAEMLHGYDRILVNPAFEMAGTMRAHGMTGRQPFLNPRQDGVREFVVTERLVKAYEEMTGQCFARVTPGERERVWGLFGDEDALVDTIGIFRAHYPKAIRFHGGHRMDDRSFMHAAVPVIRWIDDRQEKRERPVVHVDLEALRDGCGKPRPSALETVRALLERCQLFFTVPAGPGGKASGEDLAWLEQYVNVPAWGHTVLANERPLLPGGFRIGCADAPDGMATQIRVGRDTFKTWDDVAGYFGRLEGGKDGAFHCNSHGV